MRKFAERIKKLVQEYMPGAEVAVTIPPSSEMGDLAVPCFAFGKLLGKSPTEAAKELREKVQKPDFVDKIEVQGAYLNFFLNRALLIEDVITEIRAKKNCYGSSLRGRGKRAVIEHTSINPNASPHVGRARNALIGDVLARLLRFEGYDVDVHYFVNDVGKQISMLVIGAEGREDITFGELLGIYVGINRRMENNPELEKRVFDQLYELETGNEETGKRFRRLVNICVEGQAAIFKELGIEYSSFDYESDYIFKKRTAEILELLRATGKLFEDEDGRLALNQEEYHLPMKAPVLIITRSDKTTLYPLRDIAYTIDKMALNADRNIVVLGEDQKLYFQQVKAALDLLGYKSPEVVHYSFVLLKEGKMSTRSGKVVLLEDFMKEAVLKAEEEMKKRYEAVNMDTAKSIAYGAVKYAVLKYANEKNVTFDWDTALSFEGDSAPYLQYNHARICSIFRKLDKDLPERADFSLLKEDAEYDLVKELSSFDSIVGKALQELSPNIIANYVYGITKKFSSFYHDHAVLNAQNEGLRDARLLLIDSVREVMCSCLGLLGIDAIEAM